MAHQEPHERINAGDFSEWLRNTETGLRTGKGTGVPCGSCRGCCRSSMFVHIRPEEKRTIRRIPRDLLFPAPGMPKGHLLLGYDDQGRCPMLVKNECSIYEDRPQTCRDYDCRVFAATGIAVDPSQTEIADRVRAWEFEVQGEQSSRDLRSLRSAAAFLQENRNLFPPGSLPGYPVQLAAVVIRIYRIFDGAAAKVKNGEVVQAILQALGKKGKPVKHKDRKR